MKILFVHQNFPGQYLQLAQYLRSMGGHTILALGEATNVKRRNAIKGITTIGYETPKGAGQHTHHYLRTTEAEIRRGQTVLRSLLALKRQGFKPDIICAHPGWGEALFIRDAFPSTPLLLFAEFYFRAGRADLNFDPEFPCSIDLAFSIRVRNTSQVISMLTANRLLSPTRWQTASYPQEFQEKTSIIHDGIDTQYMQPDPDATITIQPLNKPGEAFCVQDPGQEHKPEMLRGLVPMGAPITLTAQDSVITYVARNLEPYRGFHHFMRALPDIQAKHPEARILIVGGEDASYSPALPEGTSYKNKYLAELGESLDLSRIHFVGKIPYRDLKRIFCISTAHVYLTYPFVLSWSVLEAMACETLVIASRTDPVQEAITHEQNGLLIDFFSKEELVNAVDQALSDRDTFTEVKKRARQTILEQYALDQCVHKQYQLLQALLAGKYPVPL